MTKSKCVGVLALCCIMVTPVLAQSRVADINDKSITLLAGEAAWMDQAEAIALSLQHRDGLRLLPMQGDGCLTATADVMQLTQVDAALLETACVDYAVTQGLLPQAREKLVYIARVDTQPLLLVTRRSITSLTALSGKRIATGPAQSAGFAAGELLLGDAGVPFVRVPHSGAEGLARLVKGEADAVILRGTAELAQLDSNQFHVLGLNAPAAENTAFTPALVDAASLSGLSATDVETVSSAMVLAVYDWPRRSVKAAKIDRLAATYVAHAATDAATGNISARVPGWKRHATAEKTLKRLAQKNTTLTLTQNGGTP